MRNVDAYYEEVGRRVRDARKCHEPPLTQKDLADRVGLSRTSITNLEKGRQRFLLHTLADLADALQVQASSLLPDSYNESQKQLEHALKNRPESEQEWVKSAVIALQKQKASDGS